MKATTLHIVSDLATPHNNGLVASLRKNAKMRVVTWYALRRLESLPWKEPLGGDVDNFYFDSFPAMMRLLFCGMFRRNDKFLLIGYSNLASKLILLSHGLSGRRLYYWSDHPEPSRSLRRDIGRLAVYFVLKRTAKKIFAVGRRACGYFLDAGFSADQIENLPICIDLPLVPDAGVLQEIRSFHQVGPEQILAVAASRLTHSKGYDTLLQAVSRAASDVRNRLRILIVGSGPEESRLKQLSLSLGISEQIRFVPWLESADYERVVSAADFFIHPARFDAFGGGTLYAMGAGVPVIGSEGAGSAFERIVPGQNGLLFAIDDVGALVECIERMTSDPAFRKKLASAAKRTAEEWTPTRSSVILENAVLGA